MRLLLFTFWFSFFFIHAQVPKFDWIIAEGHRSTIGFFEVTTDVFSNTIAAINFEIAPFDICNEKYNLNTEYTDVQFLVKYNSNGHCVWKHQLSDNLTGVLDSRIHLTSDPKGNILISSSFRGTIWLDPEHSIQSPDGVGEAFVAKLDSNGKLLWYKLLKNEMGKLGDVWVGGVTTDKSGFTYLISYHSFGHLLFDGIKIEYKSLVGSSKSTFFKLDPDGNLNWFKKFESYENFIEQVKINNDLQIVLAGSFTGVELIVDQLVLKNRDTISFNRTNDAVLMVIDKNGNLQFIKSIGGLETDYIEQMAIDNGGNIFIGGSSRSKEIEIFSKKIKSLPTSQYAINFLAKINPNYELEWLYEDHVLGMFGLNYIILNQKQELWTAWQLNRDTIYLKGMPYVSPGNSSPDLLFIRFNNNGNMEQVFQLQGKGRENAGGYECGGLHPDGGLVISGTFTSDTLYFGDYALPTVARKKVGDQYTSSAFIARISPDGMVGSKDLRNQESSLISIHPNPAQDLFQIQFDEDLRVDGRVEILTTTGTLMKSINIGKGSTSTTVDVRDWPAGVYFVRYRDIEGRSSVERVVVE
ncbi:MAG: T9SS type A sorting domain-containing protein [Saprospiraceae bacterium]|nr:T9SS type A sorting domain-containing protein [Candidatus Vicinibacter affinis]MBP6173543.1 T9SS type A sorting domain-containing protein [Saprospiraceae bacterium]MBK6574144.1 T9SS type A sorting domain-containing protein [Candidatus Vicinibacter affinis]MBK6823538.1 T9SS type A sorting domain-containing protein [Candidatus Vicinibacter affinis]MBK7302390.1 T9SS type A sorting domain-containing protein [Candidatus Vicinibacter affinis]